MTLAYAPRSSTPADRPPQAITGQTMLPSVQSTSSAPRGSFRGSITRLARFLCTLRSRDHSRTTQHSVPAGGQPLPGQDFHLLGHNKKFQLCRFPSTYHPLPSRFRLAQILRSRLEITICDLEWLGRPTLPAVRLLTGVEHWMPERKGQHIQFFCRNLR